MNCKIFLPLMLLATMLSCASSKQSSEQKTNSPIERNPALNAVLWQQGSSEYAALCHQAFNIARYRLEQMQEEGQAMENSLIVLDIDESILDNSPYTAKLILEGKEHREEYWNNWVEMQAADFVPGALDFLKFMQENGIPFVFISNRKEEHVANTIANLNKNGFYLEQEDIFYFNNGNPDKEERRNMISDEKEVIMLIGDNLKDFSSIYNEVDLRSLADDQREEYVSELGKKFILLPNLLYGDWTEGKENFSEDGSPIEEKSGLRAY